MLLLIETCFKKTEAGNEMSEPGFYGIDGNDRFFE